MLLQGPVLIAHEAVIKQAQAVHLQFILAHATIVAALTKASPEPSFVLTHLQQSCWL